MTFPHNLFHLFVKMFVFHFTLKKKDFEIKIVIKKFISKKQIGVEKL